MCCMSWASWRTPTLRRITGCCRCGAGRCGPLATCVLDTFVPRGIVCLVGNETVTEHPGRKVFGEGRHRDAKRSSHSFVAHLWGYGHRPEVGRGGAGDPREAARHPACVGVAGIGDALPQREGQPGRRSATQDSQRPDAATATRAASALVSRTTVRVCGRRWPPRAVDSARRFAWLKHFRQSTLAIPPAVPANHMLTRLARRYEQRLPLVSRFSADAAL